MKKGFSIMEVIISISIISIALLGISSLVIQNLQAQRYSKDYLIASMLAQEAIELVRNVRDLNWIQEEEDDWALTIDDALDTDYTIDYNNRIPNHAFDVGADEYPSGSQLFIDANGYYSYAGITPTKYYRYVVVAPINNGLRVAVTVKWADRGATSEYIVETFLYNWR